MFIPVLKGVYRLFRCVREVVVSFVFILFVMAFFALVSLWSNSEKSRNGAERFEQGALMLDLDGYLADNAESFGDFQRFLKSELLNDNQPLKISTFDVVQAIQAAAEDKRISGIVLNLGYLSGGDMPSLGYVGHSLKAFKQSGKKVIAVGQLFTQKQYYLASFADEIYLNKAGMVALSGIGYSNFYFKSLFDKIEAVPHVFRVGTYKSAVEPFLRDGMSPEAKQNATRWVEGMWQHLLKEIAANRHTTPAQLVPASGEWIEKYRKAKGDDALFALNQGWVNAILSEAEINRKLAEAFGQKENGKPSFISYDDYVAELPSRFTSNAREKIAVVNVEGEIVWGEGDENSAGSDTVYRNLKRALNDKSVLGVILRVNSPGGSVAGSEIIAQAVEEIQQKGKPVVVSMGGMAASGGYWISATANQIIASPSTLTGSIGIFGLAIDFEKTAKKVGISEDGVSTSPLAERRSLKALSPEQEALAQISVESGYEQFLERVASGRKLSKTAVDKIAQGQVWLGSEAVANGLVDKLGDFDDAVEALTGLINAARSNEAKVSDLEVQWFAEQEDDLMSQLMRDFKSLWQLELFKGLTPLATKMATQTDLLSRFNDPKQRYIYCLTCGRLD